MLFFPGIRRYVPCGLASFWKPYALIYGSFMLNGTVGFFLTVRPSIGGGLGNWRASGGCVRSLVFALSRPSVFCLSVLGWRPAARLAPGFMRVSGRRVVTGGWIQQATGLALR